jgi:hypothetical protein
MISKQLKADYLDFLTDKLNNMDYSEVDSFFEEHDLSEFEIEELLRLPLFVEVDEI